MQYICRQNSGVTEEEFVSGAARVQEYRAFLQQVAQDSSYNFPESSIILPFDTEVLQQVQQLAAKLVTKDLKYIVVVGIGGSNLGAKAVYDAKFGYFDTIEPERLPKIIFFDTLDGNFAEHLAIFLLHQIKKTEEIIINIITKSGNTTETIANAEFLIQSLQEKFAHILDRVVITTDQDSALYHRARQLPVEILTLPSLVGGRYSVFSAVGLFPLLAAGVDIVALRAGAMQMREKCLSEDVESNPALRSAIALYTNFLHGKTINDNFFFCPELESLGKWYRQLMAESLGKEKDRSGQTVFTGLTPTVSIGSTDLHSMGQLYVGGPKDKYTLFVSARSQGVKTPAKQIFPGLIAGITDKPFAAIMQAILSGVRSAYDKQNLPYCEIILTDLSEQSWGEFLQFKMMEIMYVGHLMNVNSFDQPNVELYKQKTKKILENEFSAEDSGYGN